MGDTALTVAVQKNRADVAGLLIRANADVNLALAYVMTVTPSSLLSTAVSTVCEWVRGIVSRVTSGAA